MNAERGGLGKGSALREYIAVGPISSSSTLGYQFDPSIRWNIVVSRFHLIDGF